MGRATESEKRSLPSKTIFWLVRFLSLLFHTGPCCKSGFLLWLKLEPLAVVQSLGGRKVLLPLIPDLPQHHYLPLLVPLDVALVARADLEIQFWAADKPVKSRTAGFGC